MIEELIAFLNFKFEKKQVNTRVLEDATVTITRAVRWQLNWRDYLKHLESLGLNVKPDSRPLLQRYSTPQPDDSVLNHLLNFQTEIRKTLKYTIEHKSLSFESWQRFFSETDGLLVHIKPQSNFRSNITPDNLHTLSLTYDYEADTYRVIIFAIIREMLINNIFFNLRLSQDNIFYMADSTEEQNANNLTTSLTSIIETVPVQSATVSTTQTEVAQIEISNTVNPIAAKSPTFCSNPPITSPTIDESITDSSFEEKSTQVSSNFSNNSIQDSQSFIVDTSTLAPANTMTPIRTLALEDKSATLNNKIEGQPTEDSEKIENDDYVIYDESKTASTFNSDDSDILLLDTLASPDESSKDDPTLNLQLEQPTTPKLSLFDLSISELKKVRLSSSKPVQLFRSPDNLTQPTLFDSDLTSPSENKSKKISKKNQRLHDKIEIIPTSLTADSFEKKDCDSQPTDLGQNIETSFLATGDSSQAEEPNREQTQPPDNKGKLNQLQNNNSETEFSQLKTEEKIEDIAKNIITTNEEPVSEIADNSSKPFSVFSWTNSIPEKEESFDFATINDLPPEPELSSELDTDTKNISDSSNLISNNQVDKLENHLFTPENDLDPASENSTPQSSFELTLGAELQIQSISPEAPLVASKDDISLIFENTESPSCPQDETILTDFNSPEDGEEPLILVDIIENVIEDELSGELTDNLENKNSTNIEEKNSILATASEANTSNEQDSLHNSGETSQQVDTTSSDETILTSLNYNEVELTSKTENLTDNLNEPESVSEINSLNKSGDDVITPVPCNYEEDDILELTTVSDAPESMSEMDSPSKTSDSSTQITEPNNHEENGILELTAISDECESKAEMDNLIEVGNTSGELTKNLDINASEIANLSHNTFKNSKEATAEELSLDFNQNTENQSKPTEKTDSLIGETLFESVPVELRLATLEQRLFLKAQSTELRLLQN